QRALQPDALLEFADRNRFAVDRCHRLTGGDEKLDGEGDTKNNNDNCGGDARAEQHVTLDHRLALGARTVLAQLLAATRRRWPFCGGWLVGRFFSRKPGGLASFRHAWLLYH